MIKFALFITLMIWLGWCLDNIVSPWMDLKLLEWRMRRELEQQRQLRQIMEPDCICVWFDHDTLIINPQCQATDHGGTSRHIESILKSRAPLPYKLKKSKE